MELYTIIGQLGISAIVVGLVQALKEAGMRKQYAGLASAGIGLLCGLVAAYLTVEVTLLIGIFGGLMAGLGGAGLYSGTKAAVSK